MTVWQLIPGVQSYEWGVPGGQPNSIVADLAEGTRELRFERGVDTPYAELWMGTHPTLPSYVVGSEPPTELNTKLCEDTRLLGQAVAAKYGPSKTGALPFLFKVLSIAKALSIQAHPNKKLAEQLHATNPSMYKDDNHKPEMAIAIRPFEGFCGFRPVREVLQFLTSVPELKDVVHLDDTLVMQLQKAADAQERRTSDAPSLVHDALKHAFGRLMRAAPEEYEPAVVKLAERYSFTHEATSALEVSGIVAELVVRLNQQFPRDIGVLCTFFLNVVHLAPGEALFLGADEPHAYLSGHILECMAASDNVVRAGLTPKARDVDVLVDMLTYQSASSSEQQLPASAWDGDQATPNPTRLYNPPIDEFAVLVTALHAEARVSTQRGVQGPSVLLVLDGKGTLHADGGAHPLHPGLVLFVGADTPLELTTEDTLFAARAFLEIP